MCSNAAAGNRINGLKYPIEIGVLLNDGGSFEVYKRYCDRDDIAGWPARYDVTIEIEHFGDAFYAVAGRFHRT